MRKYLRCFIGVLLALCMCAPEGVMRALADEATATASQDATTTEQADESAEDASAGASSAEASQDASLPSGDGSASTQQTLQQMIDATTDGGIVTISSDMVLDETVTIPAGKSIVLTDDGSPHVITSTAEPMFKVEGTLTIAATSDGNLVFQGTASGARDQGTVATVTTGRLALQGGTLKGDAPSGVREGTVAVFGGTFDMSGGVITGEQKAASGYVSTATVLIFADDAGNGSTFTMSGGSITGNSPASSWPVLVSGSTMNMSGGSIDHNSGGIMGTSSTINLSGGTISDNASSGIRINANADLIMTGGSITGNSTTSYGGGIRIRSAGSAQISGGTIANNHADHSGGGIYANNCDGLAITACSITGNSAGDLGGGIYLNSTVATSRIDNVLITGNTATLMGGGLWCCPTSNATAYVTNGMALFDNAATGNPSAGDDYVNLDQSESGGAVVSISSRMLGGGLNAFYNDGAISCNADGSDFWSIWGIDGSVGRYDASNPGEQVTVDSRRVSRALKSMPSEAAKTVARAEATTIVSGNTAKAGGGTATNGTTTSGHDDEWELSIDKAWDGAIDASRQSAVPIYLVVDDVPLEYVMVGPENNWHATIAGLPDPDSVQKVTLVEGTIASDGTVSPSEPTDAWSIAYSGIDADSSTKTMSATVTNAPKSGIPSTPTSPSANSTATSAPIPKTGDGTISPVALVAASLASLAAARLVRRRAWAADESATRA